MVQSICHGADPGASLDELGFSCYPNFIYHVDVIDNDALWLLCIALATARGIRLVVDDYLTKGFRSWVTNKFGEKSNWTYLVHCIWCTGIWISALGPVPLGYFGRGHWWAELPILVGAVALVAPALLQLGEWRPQITINNNGKGDGPWR